MMISRNQFLESNVMYRLTGFTSRATCGRNKAHGIKYSPLVVPLRKRHLKWTRGAGRIHSIRYPYKASDVIFM